MKISDLEFHLVEVPRCDGRAAVRSVLVRLSGEPAMEGWGETQLPWRPDELLARRDALLPLLAGRSVFDVEELLGLRGLRDPALRCAVEMASWDLIGRIAAQPLCHLFGGDYRRRIPLAVRLDEGPPDAVAQNARELLTQGFACQIVTSRGRWQADVEVVRAIRDSVGDRLELRLDGAGMYLPETAVELCQELENCGLSMLIDPCQDASFSQVAALARQVGVPLCVWRAIGSPSDVLTVVRCGAVPFIIIDLQRVGGLLLARKCAAVAHAGGLGTLLAQRSALGVASAALLHMAAAIPVFTSCNELPYHALSDDLLRESLSIADGMLSLPANPGLGVEIDRGKLEGFRI